MIFCETIFGSLTRNIQISDIPGKYVYLNFFRAFQKCKYFLNKLILCETMPRFEEADTFVAGAAAAAAAAAAAPHGSHFCETLGPLTPLNKLHLERELNVL